MPALCLAPLLALAQPDRAPEPDAGWIVARLARPVPARTAFVEVRESRLLDAPLRVSGQYLRPEDGVLVREVQAPYLETTTIRDGEAVIAREGRSARRISLSRVPELASLQASFSALLSGDLAALERHYAVDVGGTRQAWVMRLAPVDEAVASRLRDITLYGRGAELRCIETQPVQGALQRSLLAGAAADSEGVDDAAALAALCRGESR